MFGQKSHQIKALQAQTKAMAAENARLRWVIDQTGGADAMRVQQLIAQLKSQHQQDKDDFDRATARNREEFRKQQEHLESLRHQVEQKQHELDEMDATYADAMTMIETGVTDYSSLAGDSVEYGEELEWIRKQIKGMIRNKSATRASQGFSFNGSTAKGRKFVSDMSKVMLRSYNAEAENCMLTVKAGNGEAARKRLERAQEQVERLGDMIDLKIEPAYHSLRLRELDLTLKYLNAKKAEKEAEREERARLREEARAKKELESERARLDKERQHYANVLQALSDQGRQDEAEDLQDKLDEVESQIESIDHREANIRAGYVYVVSNIGAFGPDMVKIGMTRRLNPMDRVRELSDASVPFNFDVHALFFSEDAVSIETKLHRHFSDRKVNQINQRREFFYATPREVKDALTKVAGNLLEFVEEPEAEQFRLSQSMRLASKAD